MKIIKELVYNNESPVANKVLKIIAEPVVNMNIVARIKFSSKLKVSTSAIGYYSYTKR